MNIINIGGWYVGNTAILDWLDGFEDFYFLKGDFNIMRAENGIMDMITTSSIKDKLSMIAINKKNIYFQYFKLIKFFTNRYTRKIFHEKYDVHYTYLLSFQKYYMNALKDYEKRLKGKNKFNELNFWKNWLIKLSMVVSSNTKLKHTIYQNPYFYDEFFDGHKSIWPKLFSPYKLIFIHRDPLDQFSDIVNAREHIIFSSPRFHGGTESMHPADRFLAISRKIYNARIRMADEYKENQLAIFSFEKFLTEHDRITNKLKVFLDIETKRNHNNKRFTLESSLKNIGKGKINEEAIFLLKDKSYVMEEINHLRSILINHSNSI